MPLGLVRATEEEFGKVDILVDNAGLASVHSPEKPNPVDAPLPPAASAAA